MTKLDAIGTTTGKVTLETQSPQHIVIPPPVIPTIPVSSATEENSPIVTIKYTNWKGVTQKRKVVPIRIFWGATEFHPELQWLMEAFDVDKKLMRTFAMKDIKNWS